MPVATLGAAAIGAGTSLLNKPGSGSGGSQSSTSSTQPWSDQAPYLNFGYQQAKDIYNNRSALGPYTNPMFATGNSVQNSAIANAAGWNTGTGNTLPGTTAGTATTLQGAASPFVSNASGIASNGAGPNQYSGLFNGYATGSTPASSTNGALSSALNSAAINGASTLAGFTNGQNTVMNESLADPTSQLSADANAYMSSSPVQGAITSTNNLINQQLNEQTVPGLNREASMGGALNSSRAGMAESMANENAALATGNADSSILNNAYNTGLSTAAAERNAGLTTGMYAANSGLVDNAGLASGQQGEQLNQSEFNTNTALNAANASNGYNLSNTSLMLGGNNQLGSAAGLGINGATAATGDAANNFALGANAGGLQQQNDQANLNNEYASYENNLNFQQGLLNNYWGIVGQPAGSTTTSSGQQSLPQNILGNTLGAGVAGAGLYNMFTGSNSSPTYYNGQPGLDQSNLYSSAIGPNLNGSFYGGSSPIANAFYGLTGGG